MSVRRVDVAIVGAGAAGSAAACVLARTASVALIDRVAAPGWRIGETLPGAARRLLVGLGAWDRFAAAAHGDVPVRISRWGSDEPTEFDGLRDPDGGGWRIDRARFERDLRADAVDAGATLVEAGVGQLQWDGSRWMVPINGGDAIVADRIVATTGRGGGFSGRIGQRRAVFDRLVCVHQRVAGRDANPATYVHAVADGWWYTSLLPGGERVVAFHGDADGPAIRRVLREGPVRAALTTPGLAEAIGARVDDPATAPRCCAANSVAATAAGEGWLAAGDAVTAFDPLSSQGLFNALATGLEAGMATRDALAGDEGAARKYAARVGQVWSAYRRHHALYYGVERRWRDRPFWRRRMTPDR